LKLLTLARDLKRRKAREKRSLFVAEGIRCVEELLKSKLAVEGALISAELGGAPRGAGLLRDLETHGIAVLTVSDNEFGSAAETDSPQGVLAIGKIPRHTLPSAQPAERIRIVVLDGVQDPGNTGTILRTAAALGAAATLALPGTVDVWNAKVIRSSMGSHFRHPVLNTTEEELANLLRREGIELWGAAAGGEPLDGSPAPLKLAIAVGNEGAGLSSTVRGLASRTIAVPIGGEAESLNVAVAAGIILYELSK